jgi:hypothetical protein
MKAKTIFLVALVALASALVSSCSVGRAVTNRIPSVSAHLVREWGFAEYAKAIQDRNPEILYTKGANPGADAKTNGVSPFIAEYYQNILTEMRKSARPSDTVSEFVDVLDGRKFLCLMRAGHIISTYEPPSDPGSQPLRV